MHHQDQHPKLTARPAPSAEPPTIRFADLSPLLAPRSIAVVGASAKPGPGTIVFENLRRVGFGGTVYPINPKHTSLAGLTCYPDLAAAPGPVDCVAVLVSSRQVLAVIEQAAAAGAKAAWILASGFAEAGPDGERLQAEVTASARRHGLLVCGPNCVGTFNLHARSAAYSVALPTDLVAGRVGGVFQSGAVCLGVANSNRGLGFSTLISSGNEALVDSADYIAHLAADPATSVIVAFLEGIKRPAAFIAAAGRAREAGKPIILVKVGRSALARRAVQAHTGALAGSDAVHTEVFRRHGIIRVRGLEELLETAELFLRAPLPAGGGLGVLTLSGGQVGLIGDLIEETALRLAGLSAGTRDRLALVLPPYSAIANPLDAWGSGNFEQTYPACMEILAAEPSIDLLAVSRDSPPGIPPREVWQSTVIVDAAAEAARRHGKPVLIFSNIANGIDDEVRRRASAAGLPMLQGTSASLRAIDAFSRYAAGLARPRPSPGLSPLDETAIAGIRHGLAAEPTTLTEHASKRLLAAWGVPVARDALARSAGEAVAIAASMGGRVALKVQSPDMPHKTEAGGVSLDVSGAEEVRRAYERVLQEVGRRCPGARIDGVLVQEMVRDIVAEAIVGTIVDPEFGPVVVFGLGGIHAELFGDSVLRLAPVGAEEAREMVGAIRAAPLLEGFRGRPGGDLEALTDAIVRLSHLASSLRDDVDAVDVNPLMVLPRGQGVCAADALVVRRIRAATGGEPVGGQG